MALDNRNRRERKKILKLVYEDNLRGHERGNAPVARNRVLLWSGIGVMIVMVVALGFTIGALNRANKPVMARPIGSANWPESEPVRMPPATIDGNIPKAAAYEKIGSGSVSVARLFDLNVKTIVIDAGHGGRDPGAMGVTGLKEKDVTLDVASRLAQRLRALHGYRVKMTRVSDSTTSLKDRAAYANTHDADLFVSVHVNYFPTEPVFALETYYFGPESDASSLELAALENKNSDYSVAEFDGMMKHLGDRVKLQESKRLAGYVQRSLYQNTRHLNEKVRDWGVKTAPFVVLVGANAPGILAEIGVISNLSEESRLKTAPYRDQLASFLEEGIVNYLNERSRPEQSAESGTSHDTSEKTDR